MSEKVRKSKSKIARNQKYYEDIIAFMPGHVYWKDKDGAFLGCNLQQAKDAGFNSPDDLIGKTDYEMPWSIQADYLREIDIKVMQSGKPLTLEELFELPDGTKKIYLSSKLPLYNENNCVSGILGISFDITDRKKLEADLIKAKEEAEAGNLAKTEFLENMRHDIRTPLTGIVGLAGLIKKEAKDTRVNEYADNLIAASDMLLEFLNEILEAVKIMSGGTPIVRQKFPLHEMTKKIIQLMTPKALEKNLSLQLNYEDKIPTYIVGDYKRLQRILLEVVSNALNFTHVGSVVVSVDLVRKEKRDLIIKFVVRDTGIGMPADELENIFLRFKRLTPSYNGIYKGVGLGLAITKQFVDDMKGEIYCSSQLGEGTIFTCLFPLQESLLESGHDAVSLDEFICEQGKVFFPSIRKKSKSSKNKTHILLIEDQPLAARVAESVILELDCSVDVAENGVTALKLFQENKYDLIFMDIGLPDISGIEVAKQIRMSEWPLDEHVPIIALTAHIDSENKQNCIELGMDAVLSKPLIASKAKDILDAFIPTRRTVSKEKNEITKDSKEALFKLTGASIDMNEGASKVNGSIKAAKEVLNMLMDGFKKDIPLLVEAKNKNDWDTIQMICCKQRGEASYCGTPRFLQACGHLEEYLTSKETQWRDELYQQMLDEMKEILKKGDLYVAKC